MGTWGAGSFENDTAMDWAAGVSTVTEVSKKLAELAALDEDTTSDEPPYVDADLATGVVAAAETVATLMGRVAPDVPDDLLARLKKAEKPDADLIEKAKFAVSRILMDSELLELWTEQDSEKNEWNVAISGLIDRLNSDVPYQAPPREEIEKSHGYLSPCAFCDKPIEDGEIFQLQFRDLSSTDGLYVSRGLYCHLPCLNGKLHSRHMVQNWRFDVDEAEIDRLLGRDQD